MDLMIRYEALSRSFDEGVNYIGDERIVLPHLLKNENRKIQYVDFYDHDTRDFVSQVYADDIRYFDFSFDQP